MTSVSAVGVYDDLAAGQTTVAHRSANNETTGRIDEELRSFRYHLLRQDRIEYILLDIFMDLLLRYIRIVLCGKYHAVQRSGLAIFIVLHRNLGLAIRTKVRKGAVLANFGQAACQLVCQRDRIRHQLFRLVGSKAEHHALVTGAEIADLLFAHLTLLDFKGLVYAHGNIRALLVQRNKYRAGISIETVIGIVVSDLVHGIAYNLLNIYIRLRGDLTHNNNETGVRQGLTCHTAHRVLLDHGVQDRIGNLVADFIGMSFGYGLGSK